MKVIEPVGACCDAGCTNFLCTTLDTAAEYYQSGVSQMPYAIPPEYCKSILQQPLQRSQSGSQRVQSLAALLRFGHSSYPSDVAMKLHYPSDVAMKLQCILRSLYSAQADRR